MKRLESIHIHISPYIQNIWYRRWLAKYLLRDKIFKNDAFELIGFISNWQIQQTKTHQFQNFYHMEVKGTTKMTQFFYLEF